MKEMKTLNGYELVDANARKRLDRLEKMPHITPQMFGAKGDGVTDDTKAMRDFLNDSCALKIVPKGTYLVDQILAPNMRNCYVYGFGATIKSTNTSIKNVLHVLLSNYDETANGDSNGFIEIYGLTFDANGNECTLDVDVSAISAFSHGAIYLRYFDRVVIENCTIKNTVQFGVVTYNAKEVYCNRCNFYDIARWFDYTSNNYQTDGIVANGDGLGESFVVTNCYFERIVGACVGSVNYKNVLVKDNFAHDCGGLCEEHTYHAYDSYNHVFENNIVDGVRENFYTNSRDNATNANDGVIVLRNNVVKNVWRDNTYTGGVGSNSATMVRFYCSLMQNTNVVVEGNTFEITSNNNGLDSDSSAIQAMNFADVVFRNNVFVSTSTLHSVFINAFKSGNVRFENNIFNIANGNPLVVNNCTGDVYIDGNEFVYSSAVDCIRVLAMSGNSNVYAQNNQTLIAGDNFIRFSGATAGNILIANNITNCNYIYGMYTEGATPSALYRLNNVSKLGVSRGYAFTPTITVDGGNIVIDSITA